jgi:hypothetical protein
VPEADGQDYKRREGTRTVGLEEHAFAAGGQRARLIGERQVRLVEGNG